MGRSYFDKGGKKAAYSRKSFLYKDDTVYYDSKGNKIGYSRPSYLYGDERVYYDAKGNRIGHSRQSYIDPDKQVYYDSKNQKTGTSRRSYLNSDYTVYKDKERYFAGYSRTPVVDMYPDNDRKQKREDKKYSESYKTGTAKRSSAGVKPANDGSGSHSAMIVTVILIFGLLYACASAIGH